MTTLAPKRPTEVRRYVFDYTQELGDDEIKSFQLVVTSGAVIVNSTDQPDEFSIIAWIAGGVDQQTSTLELQITTESGQLLIHDFSLLTANASNATGSLPSSTTKGQIVNMAFEEIGLAGYEFDATAAEQASALQRLDATMAMLAAESLDLGYNFPTAIGGSNLTDISGVPDLALDAAVLKLALSIAPGYGKTLSVETRARMARAIVVIRATLARIPHVRLPRSTPRGAGAKPWSTWWPFIGSLGPSDFDDVGSANQPQPAALETESGQLIGTENGGIVGV